MLYIICGDKQIPRRYYFRWLKNYLSALFVLAQYIFLQMSGADFMDKEI